MLYVLKKSWVLAVRGTGFEVRQTLGRTRGFVLSDRICEHFWKKSNEKRNSNPGWKGGVTMYVRVKMCRMRIFFETKYEPKKIFGSANIHFVYF